MVTKITSHLAEVKAVELDRIYTDSASLREGMERIMKGKIVLFFTAGHLGPGGPSGKTEW